MILPSRGWGSWGLAATIAVTAGVLMLLLFRQDPGPKQVTARPKPAPVGLTRLGLGEGDALLQDEATFGDPTPLFLPSEWNAADEAFSAVLRREPGGAFSGFSPKLKFGESELQLVLADPLAGPRDSRAALGNESPAQGYWSVARTGRMPAAVANRGACVEVRTAGAGAVVLEQTLPQAGELMAGVWQPLEFMVAIDQVGLVGPPTLTESSRSAPVDAYFAGLIASGLHLGERLRPGLYCITVGP